MSLAPAMDAAAAPAGRGASRSAALRAALRTALMPPGSLTWLVAHDVRLKVRGRQSGLARLIGVLVLGLLPLGGGVAAAVLLMAEPDVPSRALGSLGAVTVALVLVMLSSAFAHVLRALRDRGELELLLSAPVPPSRVLAARALGIASVVALPFLILVTPFCVVAALTGHPGWLGGMAVVLIMAAIATSAAFLLADGLERLLGPARARVFAQVAGVMLGASVFALGQAPNFAPDWFSAQMDALRAVPPSPFDWPGRAILGAPLPLLALAALGVLLSVLAARVAARGLIHAPVIAAPGKAQQRRAAHSFRAGVPRALVTKELRLIARDPELISQIGQQMVFLVPVLAVIFTGGEITGARMAAAGVFVAGALASSLTWLILVAEDAPDLIGAAPVTRRQVALAKLGAALLPPMALVGLFALPVGLRDPVAALVMLPMALAAGLATAAVQVWSAKPMKRSSFRSRHRTSLLMAVGEFVLLGAMAAAARLLLYPSRWALVALGISALVLLIAWLFRQR